MRPDPLDSWFEAMGLSDPSTEPERDVLRRVCVTRAFRRGEVLWTAGARSKGLYVVVRGRIRVLGSRAGRQHLVHVSLPGATMGEVPLFDGSRYPATAVAAVESECLVFPADTVRELTRRSPALAAVFLRRLSGRVRHLIAELQRQTLGDVRSRLAASLLGLMVESGSDTVEVGASQHEWAEDLGTVREVLARELRALKRAGLIAPAGRRRFRILLERELEEMAGAEGG